MVAISPSNLDKSKSLTNWNKSTFLKRLLRSFGLFKVEVNWWNTLIKYNKQYTGSLTHYSLKLYSIKRMVLNLRVLSQSLDSCLEFSKISRILEIGQKYIFYWRNCLFIINIFWRTISIVFSWLTFSYFVKIWLIMWRT